MSDFNITSAATNPAQVQTFIEDCLNGSVLTMNIMENEVHVTSSLANLLAIYQGAKLIRLVDAQGDPRWDLEHHATRLAEIADHAKAAADESNGRLVRAAWAQRVALELGGIESWLSNLVFCFQE